MNDVGNTTKKMNDVGNTTKKMNLSSPTHLSEKIFRGECKNRPHYQENESF